MISNRWIEKRRPHWDRLSALLAQTDQLGIRNLLHEDLREMVFLYRQIASDLSALREDGSAPTLESFLNQLLGRTHNFIYSGQKNGVGAALNFLWREYPRVVRRLQPYLLASLLLFLSGALLGSLLTVARPEFMRNLLGPEMVATIQRRQMWTQSLSSMAPQASSAIMTNNLSVTFLTFASGILAGLGTIYLIGWNGVLIGVIGTACGKAHMSLSLWSFVAAHGSLEIPAIIVSGAAGLRLGKGLLFPGEYSRRYSVSLAGKDAIQLMSAVIPMLVVAGTLEGFLSPSSAPIALKFAVGALLFSALMFWWFGPQEDATVALN
jgi:uncharacterized membrane protein SpoIIM required for sporulation